MNAREADTRLELIETSPAVVEALERVAAMSDAQLRELVAGEHPMVVEAAEAMIVRRHAAARAIS